MMMMDSDYERKSKKRKCKQVEDQPLNGLNCLPQEVALDIISRLPIKSLIQFRFVCKSWHILSYNPHLVNIHLSKALKNNPYLIFHCDFPIKNMLYFVEFTDHHLGDETEKVRKFDTPFSTSLPEFNVIGSCNGILCLVNSLFEDALFVYNPFTRLYKELPKPIVFQEQQLMYGFGFDPITNLYKVIRIAYYRNSYDINTDKPLRRFMMLHRNHQRCDVQIFCLGSSSNRWKSTGKIPYQLDRRSTSVLLNGRIHWSTNYGNYRGHTDSPIVSFDLSDELFREIPGPELTSRGQRRNCHLAVLGDCLCVAVPVPGSGGSLDIWMMKEYNRKESWVKEFNIGTNFPKLICQNIQRYHRIWRNLLSRRLVRVLCLLKNGEILLEYRGGTLVSYNPESSLFNNISFPGMPNNSQATVHFGSLNWIDSPP